MRVLPKIGLVNLVNILWGCKGVVSTQRYYSSLNQNTISNTRHLGTVNHTAPFLAKSILFLTLP